MKSGLPPAAWAIRSRSSSGTLVADQRVGVLRRQRLQPQRPRPAGTPLDELRPGHAQEQERRAGREQRRRLDQIEERLVAPLEVVEDHDQRRLLLEQLPERPGDLVPARPDVRLAQERPDRRRRDRIRRQRCELLHDLDDRPVGDPLAVGQAAAPDDASLDLRRAPPPPAATCPRLHRRPPSRARSAPAPARAPTPRRSARAQRRVRRTATRGCARARPAPRRAGRPAPARDFPFSVSGSTGSADHRVVHERMRRLADQHLARLRGLLEPRRHVHRVPRRQPLRCAGHHLARVHADPAADSELRQRVAHLDRRPAGPQRVVLVRRRGCRTPPSPRRR